MPSLAAPAVPAAHHVVIVGGGFGGLQVALGLRRAAVRVTLIDRRNFNLFQPLLYQVATGGLSPSNIATPLRSILKRQRNTEVMLGEVDGIDPAARTVHLQDGETLAYDTLVVATGSRHHYFGHPEWEVHAPGLKTIEDATRMRRLIYSALERAEREHDAQRRAALMTFVVVGGGPTAVELAGALAEIVRHTVRGEFRRIDPAAVRIIVIEAQPRILAGGFAPDLSEKAAAALLGLGVEVITGARVTEVYADAVVMVSKDGAQRVPCAGVLWGAGVAASPLGRILAAGTGATVDRGGRIPVGADCALSGNSGIFVIGDLAAQPGADGEPLPGVASVAMQQGDHVARAIRDRRAGRAVRPFRYRDYGMLATIGKRLAVAQFGRLHLSGTIAWLAWVFIHLLKLVRFENRVLVLVQWAWYWLSWNRSARLITSGDGEPAPRPAAPPVRPEASGAAPAPAPGG
ncbi:MAG: NAD(P)/FAD-dependent oxidoreductase [Planctomycetes bacterium]|nr:NAD(P)/FAD-dependent oxidoreductase [Planctomycetota bacterium]